MARIYLMNGGNARVLKRMLAWILPPWLQVTLFSGQIPADGQFVILPEQVKLPESLPFPPGTAVAVSSAEEEQLACLADCAAHVIACGFGEKDTVTFSSRRNQTAIVSLLRSLEGASGTVEPMDLPMPVPPGCRDFAVLAAAAGCMYFSGMPQCRKSRFLTAGEQGPPSV